MADRKREVSGLTFSPQHFRWLNHRVAERKTEGQGGGMSAILAELIQAAIEAERSAGPAGGES